jgi:dihydroflavonol-4-reductase
VGALRKAFVTGATGFVGANLVRRLAALGCQVRALRRKNSDTSSLHGIDVEWVEGDVCDTTALTRGLRDCDACFHLAAVISSKDADALRRANVDGTRVVLEAAAAAGCEAIVHTSTMGTLNRADGTAAREVDFSLADTASAYVRSKFDAEQAALDLVARGAPIRIVNPAAPVGAWDRVPTVTGRRIVKVLDGEAPRWLEGPINHVYVGDVVEGMLLAASKGQRGERYLLASRHGNLSRAEFVRLVADAARIRPPALEPRLPFLRRLFGRTPVSRGPASLACDPSWTIERLGLPQTPLAVAFAEAVDWFRTTRS